MSGRIGRGTCRRCRRRRILWDVTVIDWHRNTIGLLRTRLCTKCSKKPAPKEDKP
jgi:hypothetical protein